VRIAEEGAVITGDKESRGEGEAAVNKDQAAERESRAEMILDSHNLLTLMCAAYAFPARDSLRYVNNVLVHS
jgi:hypothetical protein